MFAFYEIVCAGKDLPTRERYPIVVRRGSSRTRRFLLTRASRSFANTRFMLGVSFLSFNRGFPLKVQLQGCQARQDAPRRPKRPLGAILTPQEASWSDLGRVWGGQDAPQDAPRRRQDGPRRRQDVPKTTKNGPKTPLRRVTMHPSGLKMQTC